ncbi:hypothetical protein TrispH2_011479 [Trichoplax sp. H2]|nr:hypothetical protein TrispH2_011479 [Trichoplax sp. H2]|eukprot:RDD37486.1 hypothetical protein TrispH2_011479 [Trichoplax sp. H2]
MIQNCTLANLTNAESPNDSRNWFMYYHLYKTLFAVAIAASLSFMNLTILLLILTRKRLKILSNVLFCNSYCSNSVFALMVIALCIINNFISKLRQIQIIGCAFDAPTQITLGCIFNTHISLTACERIDFTYRIYLYGGYVTVILTIIPKNGRLFPGMGGHS